MKLYTQMVAPNPTKVELYLAEKAALGCVIEVERISVNLISGEQRTPEFAAKNPLQRVPFLELDNGEMVPESLAIIEYFEERWPAPSMIGDEPVERARARALERFIDGDILLSSGLIVHATRSPAGYAANPGVAEWFTARIEKALSALNATLADDRLFVAGDRPTIADCTLGAALQFARFGKLDLLGSYSHIANWDRRYRARDEVKSIIIF